MAFSDPRSFVIVCDLRGRVSCNMMKEKMPFHFSGAITVALLSSISYRSCLAFAALTLCCALKRRGNCTLWQWSSRRMEVLIAATPHVATLACLHFISEERGHIGKSVTEVLSLGTTRRSYNLTYHASPEELYVNKNLKYSYSTARSKL